MSHLRFYGGMREIATKFDCVDNPTRLLQLTWAPDSTFLTSMDPTERALLLASFLGYKRRSVEIDFFAVALMPPDFVRCYDKKRALYSARESFRKTVAELCHTNTTPRISTITAILRYVKKHGAFKITDLPHALGRPATWEENQQAEAYLENPSPSAFHNMFPTTQE